ncbi:MAG: transposase [Phycisphaerales bacterium]|nr:transposase [Phycisphaerales bacterium]
MPRSARVVVPGVAHHIVQRGNNRREVFVAADDPHAYLQMLAVSVARYPIRVVAFCLMTNHVHLVVIPDDPAALGRAIGRTHLAFSRYFNVKYGRSGHVWQNRYFSCPLDADHHVAAVRYVERNPVRAGLCREAWDYRWSSAAAHCGEAHDHADLLDLDAWHARWTADAWRSVLRTPGTPADDDRLRLATTRGRPCAAPPTWDSSGNCPKCG